MAGESAANPVRQGPPQEIVAIVCAEDGSQRGFYTITIDSDRGGLSFSACLAPVVPTPHKTYWHYAVQTSWDTRTPHSPTGLVLIGGGTFSGLPTISGQTQSFAALQYVSGTGFTTFSLGETTWGLDHTMRPCEDVTCTQTSGFPFPDGRQSFEAGAPQTIFAQTWDWAGATFTEDATPGRVFNFTNIEQLSVGPNTSTVRVWFEYTPPGP